MTSYKNNNVERARSIVFSKSLQNIIGIGKQNADEMILKMFKNAENILLSLC